MWASEKPSRGIEEARVQAFLKLLRYAENRAEADDEWVYHRMAGGGGIASLDKYPAQIEHFKVGGKPVASSAAGAYQINRERWNETVADLAKEGVAVADFSRASQDRVARQIIRE